VNCKYWRDCSVFSELFLNNLNINSCAYMVSFSVLTAYRLSIINVASTVQAVEWKRYTLFFFKGLTAPRSFGLLENFQLLKAFVRRLVGLLERGVSPLQSLFLYSTEEHRDAGIYSCFEPDSNREVKTNALNRVATVRRRGRGTWRQLFKRCTA
jgi:hypothetical protein